MLVGDPAPAERVQADTRVALLRRSQAAALRAGCPVPESLSSETLRAFGQALTNSFVDGVTMPGKDAN